MKLIILIGIAFLITFTMLEFSGELSQNKDTKTVFIFNETITVDEKNIDKSGVISADFGIVNTTSKTVQIIEVNPHCSCTGYKLQREFILPNDTTYLNLQVNIEQLKLLNKTYATIKIDHKKKFMLVRIKLKDK